MVAHSSILAWRIPGQRILAGATVHGATELDTADGRLASALHRVGTTPSSPMPVLTDIWAVSTSWLLSTALP